MWVSDSGPFFRVPQLGGNYALGNINSGALGIGSIRVYQSPRYELTNPQRVLWNNMFISMDCFFTHCVAVDESASLVRWGTDIDFILSIAGFPSTLPAPVAFASSILASRPISSVKHGFGWALFQTDMLVYNSSMVITQGAPVLSIQGVDFGDTARFFVVEFDPPFQQVQCEPETCSDTLLTCRFSERLPSTGKLIAHLRKVDDVPRNGERFQVATVVLGHDVTNTPTVPISISSTIVSFNASNIAGQITDYRVELYNFNSTNPIICVTISVGETITCSLSVRNALGLGPLTAAVSTADGFTARAVIGRVDPPSTILPTSNLPSACPPGSLYIGGANFGFAGEPQPVVTFSPPLYSCGNSDSVRVNSTTLKCDLVGPDSLSGVVSAAVSFAGSTSPFVAVANILPAPSVSSSLGALASNPETVAIFGSSFGFDPSVLNVSLFASVSSSRRRNLLEVTSCSVVSATDTAIQCVPSASSGSTFPDAGTLFATVSRAGGVSRQLSVGTLVPSPTILSSALKVSASAPSIIIRGNNFATEFGGSNVVSLFPVGNCTSSTLLFSSISSELSLSCALSGLLPNTSVALSADVFCRRARSSRVQVAQIVPTAIITRSADPIRPGTTEILIRGSNFGSEASSNNVTIKEAVSGRTILCNIKRESSTEILCGVDLSSLTSTTTLDAVVKAYGGESSPATIGAFTVDSSIQGTPPGIIAVAVIAPVLCVVAIAAAAIWYIRKRQLRDISGSQIQLTDEQKAIFNIKAEGSLTRDFRRASVAVAFRRLFQELIFCSFVTEINIIKKLGEGSYGAVWLGEWKNKFVAIKKLTSQVQVSAVNEFFREAALMLALEPSPNVVRTFGMCQERNNFSLVMELVLNGSLDVLLKNPDVDSILTPERVWELAMGIAKGMKSLADQRIVHRDLAARNILLGALNEPKVAEYVF
jgi:hypothetical protein